jgi:hypothetical protein
MMDWFTVARKLLPYAICFMIVAALAGGTAWMIQGARVDSAKAERSHALADLKVSRNNEEVCQDANKINQDTIGGLKEEIKTALQGCDSRLALKDKTLKNLKRISGLEAAAARGGNNELDKNGSGNFSSGDPLLDELNRMYVTAAGDSGHREDGIRPAANPGPAR